MYGKCLSPSIFLYSPTPLQPHLPIASFFLLSFHYYSRLPLSFQQLSMNHLDASGSSPLLLSLLSSSSFATIPPLPTNSPLQVQWHSRWMYRREQPPLILFFPHSNLSLPTPLPSPLYLFQYRSADPESLSSLVDGYLEESNFPLSSPLLPLTLFSLPSPSPPPSSSLPLTLTSPSPSPSLPLSLSLSLFLSSYLFQYSSADPKSLGSLVDGYVKESSKTFKFNS